MWMTGEDERRPPRVRAGDEAAFASRSTGHHSLLRGAMTHVSSRAVAEEVVQETWLGVLGARPLRGSLIAEDVDLQDRREHRQHAGSARAALGPFSSLAPGRRRRAGGRPRSLPRPTTPAVRSLGSRAHAWAAPGGRPLSGETRDVIRAAIEALPPAQRLVITLRDVEGWSPRRSARPSALTARNQRVLLHRARATIRAALERHLGAVELTVA